MFQVERVLSVLGVVKDVSWGLSCPFHCSGSVLPSLALGLVLGFLSGLGFGLFLAWLALKHLAFPIPLTSPSPRRENVRSRLRGYLHEQWAAWCCPFFDCCRAATHFGYSISGCSHCPWGSSWHLLLWFCHRDHQGLLLHPWGWGGGTTLRESYCWGGPCWPSRVSEEEGGGHPLLHLRWPWTTWSLGFQTWFLGKGSFGNSNWFWVWHPLIWAFGLSLGGAEISLQGAISPW